MKIILGSAVFDLHEESVIMHEIFQIAWKAKVVPQKSLGCDWVVLVMVESHD